ncbi:hypothetical protein [Aeromonas veronii]|uniref:hypothetical protein n=1 Tax=Aeromonas veronii TaxID=654 RepID=UPI003D1F2055
MKTVDLFASVATQAVQNANVRKYGGVILKNGFKGIGRLNPTLVWIDAGFAVIEAFTAYCQYSAACEVTEQMRVRNRTLEILLAQQLQIGEKEFETLLRQRQVEQEHYKRVLEATSVGRRLTIQKIKNQMALLKDLHTLIHSQRQQSGSFRQLIELQVAVDACLDATLTLMLESTAI